MKFLMFSDLHYDAVPDGDRRIDEILCHAKGAGVDFIVELGDLCYPTKENLKILDKFKESGLPCYFTVGNHNTDKFNIDQVKKFFNLKKSYYSFVKENIKFIVLDSNYIKKSQEAIHYSRKNYDKTRDAYPYIPEDELQWLKKELEDEDKYYIILSHQSLTNSFGRRGIYNRKKVRALLEAANSDGRKILFCINGHDHGAHLNVINNIHYYTLNSCSYIWHGTKDIFSYSEEIHRQYPYLKDLILYEEALHIIVNIDDNMNVTIEGMEGHYQKHSPADIGLGDTWNGVSIKAETTSLFIKMEGI